ncbi:hypothetical protein D9M68_409490 [compost metagenome]
MAGQAGLVVQARRHETDEVAHELARVAQGHENHFAARVALQVDVVLRIQRNLVLIERQLFPVQREKWLQLFQAFGQGFDVCA